MEKPGFVYIMASKRIGTIYIGSTSNLTQRAFQHRNCQVDGFTKRHGCQILVWYEAHASIADARLREAQMKKWKRQWKLSEIERTNPNWYDLFDRLF
jgi:putative endonuclease